MAPFSLVRPRAYLRDFRPLFDFPRYIGLWSREEIGQALTKRTETKRR
jgi:hypothetical protein